MKMGAIGLIAATIISCASSKPDYGTFNDANGINSNPNPGCVYEVYRHLPEGWVLSTPTVHFVFWGSYWQRQSAEAETYVATWAYLLNGSGGVLDRLSEYGIQGATLSNYAAYANLQVKSGQLDDAKFDDELSNEIKSSDIAAPGISSLYVVFLPPGTTTDKLVKNRWTGYHAWSSYGDVPFAYAIIGYSSNSVTIDEIVSHEIYEAVTNPSGQGYYDDAHGEVGDLCQFYDPVSIAGVTVQKVWSEDACRCE